MNNINNNDDYFTLPLIEGELFLKSSISKPKKHHKEGHVRSIHKKHFREYDSFDEYYEESNINNNKRHKPERNLEKIFKRMSISDHLPKSRQIKIFSDGKLSSSLSNNIYKNYYPCVIPNQYNKQIRNQINHNQINKIIDNTSEYRKMRLDNKRKNMLSKDQCSCKEDLINYPFNTEIPLYEKKKNDCCDSEDSNNTNYWFTLFRNNSGIWLNQSEDEDVYSCNEER